jgi:hypothetical protein
VSRRPIRIEIKKFIQNEQSSKDELMNGLGWFAPAIESLIDDARRTVLFWDVMRQRGNAYREQLALDAPHVLDYEVELVVDGRKLDRPVNYGLDRIVPPEGIEIDFTRRPFVIVDPPCRPWTGDQWIQGRQRNWSCCQSRSSMLFRRVSA